MPSRPVPNIATVAGSGVADTSTPPPEAAPPVEPSPSDPPFDPPAERSRPPIGVSSSSKPAVGLGAAADSGGAATAGASPGSSVGVTEAAGGAGADEEEGGAGDGRDGAGRGAVPLVLTAFVVELSTRAGALAVLLARRPLSGFSACHMPPSEADDPVDSEPFANRRANDEDDHPLHDRDEPAASRAEPLLSAL